MRTKVYVEFQLETDAPQSEAVLRRSIRTRLDEVADRYAGEVVSGTVFIVVDQGE